MDGMVVFGPARRPQVPKASDTKLSRKEVEQLSSRHFFTVTVAGPG